MKIYFARSEYCHGRDDMPNARFRFYQSDFVYTMLKLQAYLKCCRPLKTFYYRGVANIFYAIYFPANSISVINTIFLKNEVDGTIFYYHITKLLHEWTNIIMSLSYATQHFFQDQRNTEVGPECYILAPCRP